MAHDDLDPDYSRHADYKRRDRLLPWPKVRDLYGISRTTAWRLQKVGDFPQPVQISSGALGGVKASCSSGRPAENTVAKCNATLVPDSAPGPRQFR